MILNNLNSFIRFGMLHMACDVMSTIVTKMQTIHCFCFNICFFAHLIV